MSERDEHVIAITGPSEVKGDYNVHCVCGWTVKHARGRFYAERIGREHYEAYAAPSTQEVE